MFRPIKDFELLPVLVILYYLQIQIYLFSNDFPVFSNLKGKGRILSFLFLWFFFQRKCLLHMHMHILSCLDGISFVQYHSIPSLFSKSKQRNRSHSVLFHFIPLFITNLIIWVIHDWNSRHSKIRQWNGNDNGISTRHNTV